MKKIIDLVSSRIFVFVLAVLLQLVWLVALAWGMRNISTTVDHGYFKSVSGIMAGQ